MAWNPCVQLVVNRRYTDHLETEKLSLHVSVLPISQFESSAAPPPLGLPPPGKRHLQLLVGIFLVSPGPKIKMVCKPPTHFRVILRNQMPRSLGNIWESGNDKSRKMKKRYLPWTSAFSSHSRIIISHMLNSKWWNFHNWLSFYFHTLNTPFWRRSWSTHPAEYFRLNTGPKLKGTAKALLGWAPLEALGTKPFF